MRTLAAIGGYDLSQADQIRRNLDDERRLPAMRRDFLARGAEHGVDPEVAERVWDALVQFASFGFCKAHAAAFAVPTYQSAWLKAHYPAQFLAGVLTHDPGMYPRRLILDDARRRGIQILPLDVNRSEPEYVVETLTASTGRAEVGARPALLGSRLRAERSARPRRRAGGPAPRVPVAAGPEPADESRYGIRLALQDVEGMSGVEVRSILEARAERPFRDVGDFLRRTCVSRPVAEAIAHAGGFDSLETGSRRDRLFVAMTAKPERVGDQLELSLDIASARREPPGQPRRFSLPDYTDAEKVRAELEVLGLDAYRHIMSFYDPLLNDLGVISARDLWRHRGEEWVMVAGVKVASQTPAVRSGQRIVFLSLDDGTGVTEVTVFERVQPKVARTVFHSYALAVWGRLRRTGVRGVSIIAEDVWDLVALHRARRDGELGRALAGRGTGSLPPRKLWHASGGSAGW